MISLKSKREIEVMREAGEVLRKVFTAIKPAVKAGVTTEELDRRAEEIIIECGCEPAFKGYRGFPKTACISMNEQVVHGIPGARQLKEGDIVSFDIGVKRAGYFADAARTWPVGKVDPAKRVLIETAKGSFDAALAAYQAGWRIGDLSAVIQKYVETRGYQVIRDYVGHGIGRMMHEEPQVPNYGHPGRGPKIEPGLVLAIEPMVTEGHYAVETLEDGWTIVTKDRKWASHYEDTIAFTENGIMNLTGDLDS
ncbi:MAG: type I methionyl aminopeptidase [Candidatus Omnitrophica bacterium]|nr:type I methionyl aminopeptidase [Candidatus Omnitrophota bacterium]MDD5671526.1 type I methionyl aminopeptidase [Candidatus Omnitrophota bacterium]